MKCKQLKKLSRLANDAMDECEIQMDWIEVLEAENSRLKADIKELNERLMYYINIVKDKQVAYPEYDKRKAAIYCNDNSGSLQTDNTANHIKKHNEFCSVGYEYKQSNKCNE